MLQIQNCQLCQTNLRNPFYCDHCNSLQLLQQLPDYFQSYNLEKKFELNLQHLENTYDDLMLLLHPDLFVTESSEIIDASMRYSAHLKEAKDQLSDDFTRAVYLFKIIAQIDLKDSDLQPSQEFIMRMFELQSEIEFNAVSDSKKNDIKNEYDLILNKMEQLFEEILKQPDQKKLLKKISSLIGKLKFLKNVIALLD